MQIRNVLMEGCKCAAGSFKLTFQLLLPRRAEAVVQRRLQQMCVLCVSFSPVETPGSTQVIKAAFETPGTLTLT